MPIVFERRIINASNFSISLGAGYSPGLVFDHKYDLWEKATTSIYKQSVSGGGSNIIHRVVGELYFYESKSLRVAAVYRVPIRLHADVKPEIKVWVIKQ